MNKLTSLLFSLIILGSNGLSAQDQPINITKKERKDGFGAGFRISQVRQDFGLGIDITSPSFMYNSLGARLNANYYFYEHYSVPDTGNIWTPYFVSRLGIIGYGGRPAPFLRLYGEGGVVFGTPDDAFSTEKQFFGGYGLFGFEFFMSEQQYEVASYYIEIGGTGTGGQADRVGGNPQFHNGFTVNTGFRFYF